MATLVIIEHDNHTFKASNKHLISAAAKLQQPITALVLGSNCKQIAEEASKLEGVSSVLLVDDLSLQHQLAEISSLIIADIAQASDNILAAASSFGKNVLPRVAALLDVAQISEVISIIDKDTFIRPIYAGNALATVKSLDAKKVITIRPTAFEPVATTEQHAPIENIPVSKSFDKSRFVKQEVSKSERPELTAAEIVISGGRGLQSGENFKLIDQLADKLGAAVGASRAAVDAGFVPNDYQVGQTGKVVAPKLYIAIGISGAIQHLAGMKDSKVIVAINKDPDAPIFQIADYGLVGDLFQILPELMSEIEKLNPPVSK